MWKEKLNDIPPVPPFADLPTFVPRFVLSNLGPFRGWFIFLTATNVTCSFLRFGVTFLIGHFISHAADLTVNRVLTWYVPLWVSIVLTIEALDYLLRRYGEALPATYADYLLLRFYRRILLSNDHRLMNLSKERLMNLVGRYVSHSRSFVNDWTWAITSYIASLCIITVVLGYQSLLVLAFNLAYVAVFLSIAFFISSKFSPLTRALSERSVRSESTLQNFILNLNTIRRLSLDQFFLDSMRKLYGESWDCLGAVRRFHAFRWFFQLNLYRFLLIGTLSYAGVMIARGQLELGYLVLIKFAFDSLYNILVYAIEYFVTIVQQREDVTLLKTELGHFTTPRESAPPPIKSAQVLTLENARVEFRNEKCGESAYVLSIPSLSLHRGQTAGIRGPSGAGKSTIFQLLLGQTPFKGAYTIDQKPYLTPEKSGDISPSAITTVSANDPLFRISVRENLLLGRDIPADRLERVLHGLCISEFLTNLEGTIGSPDMNLSAGQEQRLRLARGLLQESDFYLLDEPFNGIDRPTVERIQTFLSDFLASKGVVIISHQGSDLAQATQKYEILEGVLRAV